MRRADKQINDPKLIAEILQEAISCHVGLSDNKIPYVVPMNFAYDKGFIYMHSANAGRKIDIIKKNPEICLQIENQLVLVKDENPCKWGMKYYSIIIMGKADFIEEKRDKIKALGIIMDKYSSHNNYKYNDQSLSEVCIIRVTIDEISGKKSGY